MKLYKDTRKVLCLLRWWLETENVWGQARVIPVCLEGLPTLTTLKLSVYIKLFRYQPIHTLIYGHKATSNLSSTFIHVIIRDFKLKFAYSTI